MVMGLLMKLIVSKRLRFDDGLISLGDMHMNLVPSIFLSELTKYYLDKNELEKLYILSWLAGFTTVRRVVKEFGFTNADEIYGVGMNFTEAMGIGLYKTHDYYPGRYTHFIIKNNPFLGHLKLPKKRKEPIDYFISGAMGGGGCFVHKTVCQNVEVKCMSMGHKICEFLTGTEKELKSRKLWKTAEKRYNLKKYLPFQKDVYKNYTDKKSEEFVEKLNDLIQ